MNILVSGGSDGLGKELARLLTLRGDKVVIISPSQEKLVSAAKEIGCSYQICDIASYDQVHATIKKIVDELGTIDALINNAGLAAGGKIEDADPEKIQRIFDVNVVGTLFLMKEVVPIMKKNGGGYIININSQAGLDAKSERTLYSGSKWALTAITKVLQNELAPSNIKVTGLYPGALEQKMKVDGKKRPQDNSISYQEMFESIEFILSRNSQTVIPELGIKNINY